MHIRISFAATGVSINLSGLYERRLFKSYWKIRLICVTDFYLNPMPSTDPATLRNTLVPGLDRG